MPFGRAHVIVHLVDADSGEQDNYSVAEDMNAIISERLTSLVFSDHEKKKDQLVLKLRNEDFGLLENPVFVKGQKIMATWGWPGKLKPPRRLIVTKVKGGDPLTVTALDTSQLMDKVKETKDWESVTDSEVVREIAQKHGYTGQYLHIEETSTRHDVSQYFMTDARMIARLARKNGFEFYIDASGLHWHKRIVNGKPAKIYIYKNDPGVGDILEKPRFDVNLSKGVSKIKVVTRDPITKQLWEIFGGPDDTEVETLGLEDEMGNPDDDDQGIRASRLARVDVRDYGMQTEEETKDIANAIYREEVKGRYKMDLSVIGDGGIGAKLLVDVYGITESWDGMYYIKECVDTVAGGKFTQRFKLEKSSLRKVPSVKKRRFGKKETPNPLAASGQSVSSGDKLKLTTKYEIDQNGDVVIVNYWVNDSGEITGRQTRDQSQSVGDAVLEELVNGDNQTVYPDSGR
jgi:phage protein D